MFVLLALVVLPLALAVALPSNVPTPRDAEVSHANRNSLLQSGAFALKSLPNPNKYELASNLEVGSSNDTDNADLLKAVHFMKQYGYTETGDGSAGFIYTRESLREKLKLVQKFGAISQTGELDQATLQLISSPRCGVRDVDSETGKSRKKRYIVGGDGWNKRRLTYHLANWSPQLKSKEDVQRELKRAFDHWSTYSYLKFTEVQTNDADIIIFFAAYDHLDGYAFDGQGGILAHAYYPQEFGHYGGDIHFDESENWNIAPKDEYSGLDFFTVAVHEIGHSLGLAHSPVQSSIMFPYYQGHSSSGFHLDYDDVMGMWELYIKRRLDGDDEYFNTTTTSTTTTPAPRTTESYDGTQNDGISGNGGKESFDASNGDADDDSDVRYQGDSETVDEHEKRQENQPDLPSLPPLFPDNEPETTDEEEDFYEKERRRLEEEQKRREEDRKRKREEEDANRRWEEDRRRQEDEIRRREAEEKREWEEENEKRRREWERKWSTTLSPPTLPPSTSTPATIPDICKGHFDSAAYIRDQLFVFKGKYLWRFYHKGSVVPGYPAKIQTMFPGLPYWLKKIDAVYERKNDSSIVFFIGKYYYVHDGSKLIDNSPRPLSDYGITSRITQIDAVFFWSKNNRTYLFSRNLYWRRDDFEDVSEENYPRGIERWNGLPKDLDTALTDNNGVSYFFKGEDVYEYDNHRIAPTRDSPSNVGPWTNC